LLLHEGAPLAPHDLWTAWSWEPAVLAGLAITAVAYARGISRLTARGGRRVMARRREAAAFWCGWVVLAIALVSPLHPLGQSLLSAHMAQHELLMVLAAPLLVLGRPLLGSLWGLPPSWRRAAGAPRGRVRPQWRLVSRVEIARGQHAVAVGGWPQPAPYP
jgi:cytochrome c oxidase assembly factor CtaG